MNKPKLAGIVHNARRSISKHSPGILTGIGIAGMITTVGLAVKATPKALRLIEEAKEAEEVDKLPVLDTVKVTWKCYIPATITCILSTACLIGANTVNARRHAALATAYQISQTALTEYKDKVVETIGEKKEKVIREKIIEDKLEKNPVNEANVIITEKGNTLCMEPVSGQYFRSDIDQIKRIINELNAQMLRDPFGYISLNELLDELGLERSSIGDDLGWNVGSSNIINIEPTAKIAPNGEPCIVIEYINPPVYKYDSFS